MGFLRLEENLIDLVKEQQAKLGFRSEVIRLYYPVSTLNHFFGSEDTAEELKAALEQSGFRDVQIHKNQRGWLCVLARK